jgi:hypothetical protein
LAGAGKLKHTPPAPADVDFIQLSKIRGAANGKTERAAGARVQREKIKSMWAPYRSVAASGLFGGKESP